MTDTLDKMEDYDRLKAENEALREKLAAVEAAHTAYKRQTDLAYKGSELESKETIEALQLRVARLVDALQKNDEWHTTYDEYGGYQESELGTVNAAALSATQDDQAWLREQKADTLEHCAGYFDALDETFPMTPPQIAASVRRQAALLLASQTKGE